MPNDVKNDESKKETPKHVRNKSLLGKTIEPVPNNQSPNTDVDVYKYFPDHVILGSQENILNTGEIEKFTSISNNRSLQYGQIDNMFLDASVSAIQKTIVDNVCRVAENGHMMWVDSNDPKISKFLNYVLSRINVDKYLPRWTGHLVKYGDIFLRLSRKSDFEDKLFTNNSSTLLKESVEDRKTDLDESINLVLHKNSDPYTFHLELVADPSTMFELSNHDITMGFIEVPNEKQSLSTNDMLSQAGGYGTNSYSQGVAYNYRLKAGEINLYSAEDFVHGCLDSEDSRFPETVELIQEQDNVSDNNSHSSNSFCYNVVRGKSMFYDVYKIWREKSLLESSLLLARLTKSSVFRLVKLETGNTDKTKSSQLLHQVKDMFEQKRAYLSGEGMQNYNMPGPIENWIYINVRNSVGNISVETVGEDYDPKSLVDLDWWNNKFYGSFGIPKQYFGWTDDSAGFNGGEALTVISSVFQSKITNIQNVLIQTLNSCLELICWQKGLKSYIGNFTVKMKTPLSTEEIKARENFTNKLNEISTSMSLFTDVETRSNRLKLLKYFMNKIDSGADVSDILDAEIKAAEEAEQKARDAEEAEANAALEGDGLDLDLGDSGADLDDQALEPSGEDNLNLDLGSIPPAPDTPAQETFAHSSGSETLNEDIEFLDESEDLPSPDELGDGNIDFSENN